MVRFTTSSAGRVMVRSVAVYSLPESLKPVVTTLPGMPSGYGLSREPTTGADVGVAVGGTRVGDGGTGVDGRGVADGGADVGVGGVSVAVDGMKVGTDVGVAGCSVGDDVGNAVDGDVADAEIPGPGGATVDSGVPTNPAAGNCLPARAVNAMMKFDWIATTVAVFSNALSEPAGVPVRPRTAPNAHMIVDHRTATRASTEPLTRLRLRPPIKSPSHRESGRLSYGKQSRDG